MKLLDTIILSIAIGLLFIGVHLVMSQKDGFANNYHIFMLMLGLLGWFQLRRMKRKENE